MFCCWNLCRGANSKMSYSSCMLNGRIFVAVFPKMRCFSPQQNHIIPPSLREARQFTRSLHLPQNLEAFL